MAHPEDLIRYLQRIYAEEEREYWCRASTPGEVTAWQGKARPALMRLIGIDAIAESSKGHTPKVTPGRATDHGAYVRIKGQIGTEPDVWMPFWMLRPKGDGPFPLAVLPHGHDKVGWHTYAGIASDPEKRRCIVKEDRDVGIQAASEGMVAITPATRGLAEGGIAEVSNRHGGRNCRAHFMHAILAGRTAIGERVWDMQRIIDWATSLPFVEKDKLLMMGNSGGGIVTIYTAACDTRVDVAVPSCCYTSLVGSDGLVHHCDCNAVPGVLRFGGFWDIAGLIAPRHLLIINGRHDSMHAIDKVDYAVERLAHVFAAAGASERFGFKYGPDGHRFYKDLMWPFIRKALGLHSVNPTRMKGYVP